METIKQKQEADEYEINFLKAKGELIACQDSKNLASCMVCPNILECKVREEYVVSTYKNMNKGQSGAFDFN